MKEIRVLSQPSFHYFTKKRYTPLACRKILQQSSSSSLPTSGTHPFVSKGTILFRFLPLMCLRRCFVIVWGQPLPKWASKANRTGKVYLPSPWTEYYILHKRWTGKGQDKIIPHPVVLLSLNFILLLSIEFVWYFDSNRIWNIIWSIYHYYYKWTIIARGQEIQRVIIWSEQESY